MQKKNINETEEMIIVVDMINGFMKGGVMADPYIMHIVPTIRNYMEEAIQNSSKNVVVIRDAHEKGAMEFKVHPEHCLKDSWESSLIDELRDLLPYCYEFEKNSTSTIWAGETNTFLPFIKKALTNPKLKRIKIVGCCTDICVMDLAIPLKKLCDELNIDIEVIVPTEAVETYQIKPNLYDQEGRLIEEGIHDRQEWNDMAFKFMNQAGINVLGYQKVKR